MIVGCRFGKSGARAMFLFASSPPARRPEGIDEDLFDVLGWVGVGGGESALATVGPVTVALVGEVHYPEDLRARIRGSVPHEPLSVRPAEDARLMAGAWLHWGPRALQHVEGTYAGVVLDRQSGAVSVFRDITAGRRAYLSVHAGTAVAGSSLDSVSSWEGRPRRPDGLFVASYVQNQWLDARCTPYDGVQAVEGGCTAQPNRQSWVQERHASWRLRRLGRRGPEEYVDLVAETLDGAMRERLRGVTRAGVSLSGGLDSTNVLASGIRVAPHVDWTAYCIPFYSAKGDERSRQTAVAEHLGVRQSWVSVEGMGPLGTHDPDSVGTPRWAGNWYFRQAVVATAVTDGTEVIFDGEDADSVLTGSLVYLSDLFVQGRWRTLRRQVDELTAVGELSRRTAANTAVLLSLPRVLTRRLVDRPAQVLVSPLVARSLADQHDLAGRLEAVFCFPWAPGRLFRASQAMGCSPAHLDFVAVESARGHGGAPVLDAHPFTDRRMIELALSLPWHAVTPLRPDKHLLKELAARRLPVVRAGPFLKADLDEYFEQAGRTFERELILEGLRLAADMPEVFERGEVGRVVRELIAGGSSWRGSRAASIALWLDSF